MGLSQDLETAPFAGSRSTSSCERTGGFYKLKIVLFVCCRISVGNQLKYYPD